jgi:hypothetical protein
VRYLKALLSQGLSILQTLFDTAWAGGGHLLPAFTNLAFVCTSANFSEEVLARCAPASRFYEFIAGE